MMLSWTPQLVADCAKKWFGLEYDGTEVKYLLNNPNSFTIAVFTGSCSCEKEETLGAMSAAERMWSTE
jgi:hypothetical protein